jgi:hypothetical protein
MTSGSRTPLPVRERGRIMHDHLSIGGWFFLITAWAGIIILNVYCFWNIFREREEEIAEPVSELEEAEKNH